MSGWLFRVFLLLTLFALAFGKDYYDLLKVPRGANDAQLKRSYRKLALQYHPDKITGSEDEKKVASEKFAEINHAYEVLSNPEKRRIYDQQGEEGLKQANAREQHGGGMGGDPFEFFFGGGGFGGFGGFGGRPQEEEVRKGSNVVVDLKVTLDDLYNGREIAFLRDKTIMKEGSGTRQCKCRNKMMTRQLGPGMFQQYQTQECETCPSVTYEREQATIAVHIEPGMVHDHRISFFEEGEPLADGEPGDLVFVLKQHQPATPADSLTPSPRAPASSKATFQFRREGNDLLLTYSISLLDALVGFKHEIKHLDGHTVVLSWTGVTKPAYQQTYTGEGMPVYDKPGKYGDLIVTYVVSFPDVLTPKQQQLAREMFR
uniref:J domain-containing protein n=1 Tax=Polytomella parva TaxID=51329 RepID=A0A7S0US37_9CHLO|mmetsp:Transcript_19710/g.35543  ORF Transcript_19710/g.35543 Transcript_19710/m.35543 type:complete len:373 (+) Transcript_19710:83-1201(+)